MKRTESIIAVGIFIGFVMLGMGLAMFRSYSLVGMMLLGPIVVSVGVVSLSAIMIEGKGLLIGNIGAKWVSRGEDGYRTAGVHAVLCCVGGLAMVVYGIVRSW